MSAGKRYQYRQAKVPEAIDSKSLEKMLKSPSNIEVFNAQTGSLEIYNRRFKITINKTGSNSVITKKVEFLSTGSSGKSPSRIVRDNLSRYAAKKHRERTG